MKTKNFIGLAAALMFSACQSNTFHIKGEAKDFADGTILYLTTDLSDGLPTDSIIVDDGKLSLSGTTDSTLFCRLYVTTVSEPLLTFFIEPGNIYLEMKPANAQSRVSGTVINNEWQALNDATTLSDLTIRELFAFKKDSINLQQQYATVSEIYHQLNLKIAETAHRNKDNALGHFISSHYLGSE